MREFLTTERMDPEKRLVVERTKDFGEIYEVFNLSDASSQSERCIQCGDPFCLNKCPLHNYIPQWLKSIAEKDLEFAFKLSNEPSPFPEVMGRVCPHDKLCEGDCTLNDGHGAITIGSIETHITEAGFKAGYKPQFPGITTDKKVAVIGSGPAGLSAATYLLRSGIAVTMYEKADRAGGLLTYGIPSFKLDKKIVERRVNLLLEAGLKLVLNCEVGKDLPFEDIANTHDAMFIGVGATKSKHASIVGEQAPNKGLPKETYSKCFIGEKDLDNKTSWSKPIALIEKFLMLYSKQEEIIVDTFLGTGSTLIACEKNGRNCYGMELDEHYSDVIIKRWEDYTGLKAEKI